MNPLPRINQSLRITQIPFISQDCCCWMGKGSSWTQSDWVFGANLLDVVEAIILQMMLVAVEMHCMHVLVCCLLLK